ncbi:GerW family sporulation protein [Clostridium cavendishii]|nr:spore germination protein GerW family protein [Clostridium cavendishii]
MENSTFSQNMDTVFDDLHNFVKTDSVLGTPLPIGDKTLVPIMSVTLGYGNADMPQKSQSSQSNGTGIGGIGAKISAEAVVVVDKDNVNMLNINDSTNMNQLINKIPEALNNITQNMSQKSQGQQNQQQQGQQTQQHSQSSQFK